MSAAAEKFMKDLPVRDSALAWLKTVPADAAPDWMRALRETGRDAFAATGLPELSWEGWQYTNLRALSAETFCYVASTVAFDVQKLPAPLVPGMRRIVVVNGQVQERLCDLPQGVTLRSLTAATEDDLEYIASVGDLAEHPFKALNAAHVRDGFILDACGDVAEPLEVLLFNTGEQRAAYPRILYRLRPNSGLTLVERHAGAGVYFADAVTDIVIEPAARMKFYRVLAETGQGFDMGRTSLHLHKDAQFEGFSAAFGTRMARQEIVMKLLDRAIHASISGVYLLKGQQTHDFTILADHFEEGGTSVQNFKGVIDDQARSVFQGKIHVRRTAQKTDGYQSHHALLLSRQAEASAKPELEIYADDVKCSHGATSGFLDEAALFYLRSRGIPQDRARALLVESFVNEGLERITDAAVRGALAAMVADWLQGEAHVQG